MNIETRLSAMQKLADTLSDSVSQMEDGTALLGEWKDLADEYEPEDITCKLDELEAWEELESNSGLSACEMEDKLEELDDWVGRVEDTYGDVGTVVDKLDSLEQWEDIERNHGDADDVEHKLGEAESLYASYGDADYIGETLARWAEREGDFGTVDDIRSILKEHGTTDMEELKSLLAETNEERDFLVQRTVESEAALEALKHRTRWQVFLSLFTGWRN